MHRKEFIKQCGFTCLGGALMTSMLEGCSTSHHITGQLTGGELNIPLAKFENGKGTSYHNYMVVQHDALQYPICVFRLAENEFIALLMQCTHQGAELQVFGDKLQCPAHGSEFTKQGEVQNGPADKHLRTLPVHIVNDQIKISLNK
ncbi:Rieske (2Fe-2S) protein [Chitinophaga pendula]|uniref:QcrA and Rieske domain-containing protein n=1 Tax=Chitinophaga TaxID=79328 RepID=UPI000BAFC5FA|nr:MULTISPECIES: Rieske (2Fe-2S) protein [Chitinophaga]ASZ13886.1 hypothetical protein CK934_24475 [Chitinophaga sp. MD30]UCJ08494.1 Rieske (2Fe-2S) protein [Chitinophaga pendula]